MIKHNNSKNRISGAAVFLTCTVLVFSLLTGCGSKEQHVSRITIDKEGTVVSTIYEPFEEEYYDTAELKDMASSEISYYNSEYTTDRITVEAPEFIEDDKLVKLTMTYSNSSDYSHFNQSVLFYGTVKEAQEAGFTFDDALVGTDGQAIASMDIIGYSDNHIIIATDKVVIDAPYEIMYMTKGVTRNGKKEAILSDTTSEIVQLLLSK